MMHELIVSASFYFSSIAVCIESMRGVRMISKKIFTGLELPFYPGFKGFFAIIQIFIVPFPIFIHGKVEIVVWGYTHHYSNQKRLR